MSLKGIRLLADVESSMEAVQKQHERTAISPNKLGLYYKVNSE